MSGTAPQSSEAPRTPPDAATDDGTSDPVGRSPRARWWLVAALVVAVVVVLVWRPWASAEPVPAPTPTVTTSESTVERTPSPTATPGPTPEPTPSAVPVPGADAVFDATTASSLFTTTADVVAQVPAAAAGVRQGVAPGTGPWGLPAGAVVEPASCTTAVTVVDLPPAHYDASSWVNDELTFEQEVVLLLDAAAARAAFRALVTTVDECPRYARVVPASAGTTWTTEPALEGQGVFPAIVQDVTAQSGEGTVQQTTGHVLVGNAILTWTATALDATDRQGARAVLGEPADLSAMVEKRALAAVRALP